MKNFYTDKLPICIYINKCNLKYDYWDPRVHMPSHCAVPSIYDLSYFVFSWTILFCFCC